MTKRGADAEQREVAGAAAEVADHHQFVMVKSGFVMVGGAHGLVLEYDLVKARDAQRFFQAVERVLIIRFRLCANEADRAAYDDSPGDWTDLFLRANTNVGENACNELFQFEAPAKYVGGLQAAASEERLEGLDEPAFFIRMQILIDSGRAAPRLNDVSTVFAQTVKVQERAEGFRRSAGVRKLDDYDTVWSCKRNRAVGSSEIQTDSHH